MSQLTREEQVLCSIRDDIEILSDEARGLADIAYSLSEAMQVHANLSQGVNLLSTLIYNHVEKLKAIKTQEGAA